MAASLVLTLLVGGSGPVAASSHEVLYVADDIGSTSTLRTVNTATGATTSVGSIGSYNVTGLASHNGTLYAVAYGPARLLTINPSTGQGTVVFNLVGQPSALVSHGGTLYYATVGPKRLYSIDLTAQTSTLVGSLGQSSGGMASMGGTLYLVDYSYPHQLHTVDPSDASLTLVGALGSSITPQALAAHQGTLYVADITADKLYTVNATTGAATVVGAMGTTYAVGMASHSTADRPDQPSAPTVTATSASSVSVSWSEPDDNGAAITSYDLHYRVTGTSDWTLVSNQTGTSYTITGLSLGTEYEVQVRATNTVGDSDWSTSGTATTPSAVPDTPATPTVTVRSATSLLVSWTEPDDNGDPITGYDLQYRETGTSDWTQVSDETGTSYTIAGLSLETEYEVQVRATNSVGDSDWSSSGTATTTSTVPYAPAAPTVTALSATSTSVSWSAPSDDGGETITGYDLQYRETGTSDWSQVDDETGTSYTITGLSAGTEYEVQVRATNSLGDSDWSTSGTAKTTSTAPDTPTLTVTVRSATSLLANWTEPDDNGEPITGYDLQYRTTATSTPTWSQVDDQTDTSYTIAGLSLETEYEVQVRATNSVGDSGWSSSGTATTTSTVPYAPSAPTVTVLSATSLSVSWSAPSDDGGETITGYDLQYRETSTSDWTQVDDETGTSYTITGLSAGTEYEVQVRATNSLGDSDWSTSGTAKTTSTAPDTPTLSVTVRSATSLLASWSEPDDNGETITGYDLQYRETDTSDWTQVSDQTGTSYTITGLSLETEYEVQVRATNSVGDSGWSSSETATTTSTVPYTPDAPTVTVRSATSLLVSWTAPSDDGGETVTGYDLQYRETGTSDWTQVDDQTGMSYTITGLSLETEYEVQVRATNSVGDSGWSSSEAATTTSTVPYAPDAPAVTVLSPSSVSVTWSAPSDDGGETITGYDLQYRETGTTDWTQVSDETGTSYTITGLSAGTEYEVQVRATNSLGDSDWSTSGTATTTTRIPDAPDALTITAGSATLEISWSEPAEDGGVAITSYDLQYRETGTSAWSQVLDLTGTSYTITGLSAGTGYEVQVRATNSLGDSGWSTSGTATTATTVPSAPAAPTVTAASSSSVEVDWDAPTEDGGTTVTGYDVQYRASGGSTWTQIDNLTATETTITSLSSDTTYEVQVRAQNSNGEGSWSVTGEGDTAPPPLTDDAIRGADYLTTEPSIQLLASSPGDTTTSGIRWRVSGTEDETLEEQPGLLLRWRVKVYTSVDDSTADRTLDVTDYGAGTYDSFTLECGGTNFLDSDHADLCSVVTDKAAVYGAEKFTFRAFVRRTSDSQEFESSHSVDFISVPQPEVLFTLMPPEVQEQFLSGVLTLVVVPAPGTQTTQVLINNEPPTISYSTDTNQADAPALFTLQVPLSDDVLEKEFFSYAVRGAVFAADTALTVEIDGDGTEVTIPPYSWNYTPYTNTRYIATASVIREIAAPEALLTPVAGDDRVTSAIEELIASPGLDLDDISADSLKTGITFVVALVAGGLVTAAVSSKAGGLSPIALVPGSLVFCLIWSVVGPVAVGIPWVIALPPLVVPPMIGFMAASKRV